MKVVGKAMEYIVLKMQNEGSVGIRKPKPRE
jgi:hypothetical protein